MNTEQQTSGGYNITPEQKEKMKRFGKKNGLSEDVVQAHLESNKTEAHQPAPVALPSSVKPTVAKFSTTKPIVQPPIQTPIQRIEQLVNAQEDVLPCETYFCFEDDTAGNLEIDLITFREKGIETRYLSLVFSGIDVRQNPPIEQNAFLNIESKEEFERIKAFFAQLEWER